MKYLTYILRNARRNPVRTGLTVASTAICLFLMMILLSFFSMNEEASRNSKVYNRVIVMNANGFTGMIPIARVRQVAGMEGVAAATAFSWFGGKYQGERALFAQFACDADAVFKVMDEFKLPPEQLAAFIASKDGAVVGPKLARDYKLKVGDSLPIQGDIYPVDLKLVIKGIYDSPSNTDQRMCLFHYDYLDDLLKTTGTSANQSNSSGSAPGSGNAGMVFVKCKSAEATATVCKRVDEEYKSTEFPTRTQTEEAFGQMFSDMMGDLKDTIYWIGGAVVVSLLFVAGNAMAMSMRERTTEVAVLKAIGFSKGKVLFLVLAEAVLVAGLGGALGTLGCKGLCDAVDVSRFMGGFLPFYYVPWKTALIGLGVSLFVGFVSGLAPAVIASNTSVVNGLRKVV